MMNNTALLGACVFICASIFCFDAAASERAFLWDKANAVAASAQHPEDYLVAAETYRELADMGVRNGPLFYNMGTALLHAGQYENAVDALLRAERYLGGQSDVARNLKIAMARNAGHGEHTAQWHRTMLFWHFKLSAPVRTASTAIAFSLFWIFMALRTLGAARWIRAPLVLCILFFVLLGVSAFSSWRREAIRDIPRVMDFS